MRTLVQVGGANCTFCMQDVRAELLSRPRVQQVNLWTPESCLEVVHEHDDVTAITDFLRRSLHGWEVADNGEIVMVETTPESVDRCQRHGSQVATGDSCSASPVVVGRRDRRELDRHDVRGCGERVGIARV